MKTFALIAGLALGSSAMANPYIDATSDLFDNGFAHLDIVNVTVSHTATHMTFDILLGGDVNATNWGKYMIGINTGAPGADTSNGWGPRPVSWNGQAINYWIGTWADTGGEVRQMTGNNDGSNILNDATYIGGTQMTVTPSGFHHVITFSRASIGFTGDGTIFFDVLSSGGGSGDPGVDHLSRSDMSTPGWSTGSVAGQFLSYTIPTPGSIALIGLSGLAAIRRRR